MYVSDNSISSGEADVSHSFPAPLYFLGRSQLCTRKPNSKAMELKHLLVSGPF